MFHRKKPLYHRKNTEFFLFCAPLIAAFLFFGRRSEGWFGDVYVAVYRPFAAVAGYMATPVQRLAGFMHNQEVLRNDANRLRQENRSLRELFAGLSESLGVTPEEVPKTYPDIQPFLAARVVGKGAHLFGQEIFIDRGM